MPVPSPRHGAALLEQGICGRGHTLADVFALEIHPDAIRCARCVDEIAADVAALWPAGVDELAADADALPPHWPAHRPAPAAPLEVLTCAVCGRILDGPPEPFDVICRPCVDVLA